MMTNPLLPISIIFALSLLGILLLFFINPLLIVIFSSFKGKNRNPYIETQLSVCLLIAAHNEEKVIDDKISGSLKLQYPSKDFEIIVVSDGSTDATEKKVRAFKDNGVRLLKTKIHAGKNNALNTGVVKTKKDIIVFTDADTEIEKSAIMKLTRYFSDPDIGAVCGRKIFRKKSGGFGASQKGHAEFDHKIKIFESRLGTISSNDGTLYAMRRELYTKMPQAVTDDLFACLAIASKKKRFIYEPEAQAFLDAPSRNPAHEIERRRRIVSCSLRGIFFMSEVLNPLKYGYFSIRLFINKVLRRFLPVCLILLFFSSLYIGIYNLPMRAFFLLQLFLYLMALAHGPIFKNKKSGLFAKISSVAFYFTIGNYGTLLGLWDWMIGKETSTWIPFQEEE